MSHPLMVEAIETLFVPVLVYNNKPEDADALKRFKEPSWNNPIVRYLDGKAKDVIPRKSNVWTTTATAERMVKALIAAKRPVPGYLDLIAKRNPSRRQKAEFSML